jgi:uncharacterized protein (DUF169 family)
MNTQYGVLAKNGINYTVLEEGDKMYLRICEGKVVLKFPITKEVISTLNWLVNKDTINSVEMPKNSVIKY